ncbi:DUF2800 domain-containing protein, partial [Enterococcus faecalis]|uniref:DUF2800 domain-containing protein n=1 Tax=Enterococcus faecalis TaxID=1351 RepID=UPI001F49C6C6
KKINMQIQVKANPASLMMEGDTEKLVRVFNNLLSNALKYGKGVPVDAYLNPQLMLYALGAVDKYDIIYEFETVRMTIIQPRLDNISTFEIEKEELLYWADNYV